MQTRHDVPNLIAALRHSDPEVRKRAGLALHALDATAAVPALRTALRQESDEQTRRGLKIVLRDLAQRTDINVLAQNGDVDGLIEALASRHTENTIAAAEALGALGDRRAVEPLVILFQNSLSSPKVRLAAAEALLQLQSAPAVVTLLGALRRDSWQVRRNAAAVLGQIQAVWAVEPLIEALQDSHPVVRRTAAAALRRIGTADAIQALRTQFTEGTLGKRKSPDQDVTAVLAEKAPELAGAMASVTVAASAPASVTAHATASATATAAPTRAISAAASSSAASNPLLAEPPISSDDTVPSNATRLQQSAAQQVTLNAAAADTPLARSAVVRPVKEAKPEKPSRSLLSVRRLIDFLNR